MRKAKILVITVSAGGGHLAAASAIRQAIGKQFDVVIDRPMEAGANEYNMMQRAGWYEALNVIGFLQDIGERTIIPMFAPASIGSAIEHHQPDLIISVIPTANPVTWAEAKKRDIPMLLLPTDLSFNHFVRNLGDDIDDSFRIGLPFDAPFLRAEAGPRLAGNLATTGYPVRPEFTTASRAESKSPVLVDLGVRDADKVVLMMMGAEGVSGSFMIDDATTLAKGLKSARGSRTHVVCLCGKNDDLQYKINAINDTVYNPAVRLHALGMKDADAISTLMHRGAVIITKPGGSTVNEALAAKLPMLFRDGIGTLPWELGNSSFVTQNNLGSWTTGGDTLLMHVENALAKPRTTLAECPARSFGANLTIVLEDMLHRNAAKAAAAKTPTA